MDNTFGGQLRTTCQEGCFYCSEDNAFNVGTGVFVCFGNELLNINAAMQLMPLLQVQLDNLFALGWGWKIDKEDFVKTPFA